jgi:hypothetical protein
VFRLCDVFEDTRVMLRGMALMAAIVGVSGAAVELTPDNWDKEVASSGKAAFIKFLAPW